MNAYLIDDAINGLDSSKRAQLNFLPNSEILMISTPSSRPQDASSWVNRECFTLITCNDMPVLPDIGNLDDANASLNLRSRRIEYGALLC